MVLTDMDVDQRNGRGKGSCHGMLMQVVCMGGRLLYTISSVTGFCSGSLVLCKQVEIDSIYNFSILTSPATIVFTFQEKEAPMDEHMCARKRKGETTFGVLPSVRQ